MDHSKNLEIHNKRTSALYMVLCAILWSIGGHFIKVIPWNPFVIAGSRSLVAAVVMAVYMAVTGVRFRLSRAAVLSGAMLSLTFLAFVTANKLTTSANAIVLQYIAPVFILLLSALIYKQRFRKTDYAVVSATILGVALCFSGQLATGKLIGNFIGILSGVFMAAMFVFTGNTDSETRWNGLLVGHILTAIIGLPAALLFDTPVNSFAVLNIVILGVVQIGVPYILYGLAVRHCSPLLCCLLGTVEPLLNPVWVFIFDGETPGSAAIVGGLIVIAAITVWSIYNERHTVNSQR